MTGAKKCGTRQEAGCKEGVFYRVMTDCDIGTEPQGTHSSHRKALSWPPWAHLRRRKASVAEANCACKIIPYSCGWSRGAFEAVLAVESEVNLRWVKEGKGHDMIFC